MKTLNWKKNILGTILPNCPVPIPNPVTELISESVLVFLRIKMKKYVNPAYLIKSVTAEVT